jgi:hypothetical protein
MTTIPIDKVTSNARAKVRYIWRRGNVALTRPSTTGRGDAILDFAPDAQLDTYYAAGWQLVTPAEETTDG